MHPSTYLLAFGPGALKEEGLGLSIEAAWSPHPESNLSKLTWKLIQGPIERIVVSSLLRGPPPLPC